ncbi:hypothetical protein [Nostoc sp. CHAB 5715]|uniref:hypothetical protein n=1 Tax=Nostoc sp. CHAB 5715 TaxID=2780400 RepID=UPI001E28D713|nr:hypothetical protein [Nostoc sp. CHAB 5715]
MLPRACSGHWRLSKKILGFANKRVRVLWQATTSISTQIKRRSLWSGQLLRSPLFLLRR